MIGDDIAGSIIRALAAVRQECFRPKRRWHLSHVLIIEDEILLAFSVEEALRNLGYLTFDIVTSAPDAIEAAEQKCPDLIIADHQLIDGTGVGAVKAICADQSIPVVFVTGSRTEGRQHLPEAFIVDKPFNFRRLKGAVSEAVETPFRFQSN